MAMAVKNVADRATAYGIPGVVVDGNDVLAVYEVTCKAVERARRGDGPTLIECKTYRQKGHSRVDPARYRPKEEVEAWLLKDPIKRFREKLLEENVLSEVEIRQIENDVLGEIEEAVKFAMESPLPDPEEALEDVYA
jgi:pyruvate dehydrogenase E1 component alpha subunit